MKTQNILKSLIMSAFLLMSLSMVSCKKDAGGHPVDFDAQITASPAELSTDLGKTVAVTVVCNTDWVLVPRANRILIDDCDAYTGEEGTTTVHITIVPTGDDRLEEYIPGSKIRLDFQAIGYVQGLQFTRHSYVDIQVGKSEE